MVTENIKNFTFNFFLYLLYLAGIVLIVNFAFSLISFRSSVLSTMAVFVIFLAGIGYYLFYPIKLIEVREPVPVIADEIKPKSTIRLRFEYKNYTVLPHLINKVLFNLDTGERHHVIITHENLRFPIGNGTFIGRYEIPEDVVPGNHRLEIYATYQVNFFKVQTVHFKTEEFVIT